MYVDLRLAHLTGVSIRTAVAAETEQTTAQVSPLRIFDHRPPQAESWSGRANIMSTQADAFNEKGKGILFRSMAQPARAAW